MPGRLTFAFFTLSVAVIAFLFGVAVAFYQFFPYRPLWEAKKTLEEIIQDTIKNKGYYGEILAISNLPVEKINSVRMISRPGTPDNGENFLMFGGLNQYLDLCPEHGCLAVEVTPTGDVVHAYPYLPREIYAANTTDDYPYEYVDFDPLQDTRPIGIDRYPNGDLLVTFQAREDGSVFPYGTGVARVDREGKPRWFRFDYSHHWPSPLMGDVAMVPAMSIGDAPLVVRWPDGTGDFVKCDKVRYHRDSIRFLGGNGQVMREISVLDSILQSPYAAVLRQTSDPCDPVHLNFIDVVHDDFPAGLDGIEPGDLVVSLRNLSSFAIIDAETGRLKRLVRGTFIQQHSVQHLSRTRFLLFDNQGGDRENEPSRVLEVDLATGEERTVFPTPSNPGFHDKVFSRSAGYLAISPDRKRLIVTSTHQGLAVEIRLSDGAVLKQFNNVHDVSGLGVFEGNGSQDAAIFRLFGVAYVPR